MVLVLFLVEYDDSRLWFSVAGLGWGYMCAGRLVFPNLGLVLRNLHLQLTGSSRPDGSVFAVLALVLIWRELLELREADVAILLTVLANVAGALAPPCLRPLWGVDWARSKFGVAGRRRW